MNAPVWRDRSTSSAVVRVLGAVQRYFRVQGYSPSYRDIHVLTGATTSRIRSYLDQLQREGFLQHQHKMPRSIVMVDRGANLSDEELEAACHGRGWTVIKPPPVALALFEAIPVDMRETDCLADLVDQLRNIE